MRVWGASYRGGGLVCRGEERYKVGEGCSGGDSSGGQWLRGL